MIDRALVWPPESCLTNPTVASQTTASQTSARDVAASQKSMGNNIPSLPQEYNSTTDRNRLLPLSLKPHVISSSSVSKQLCLPR